MSNCHVRELGAFYASLMKDCAYAFPTMGVDLSRDLSRLQAAVKSRGIRVYLEDLPAIGKHFDRCLSGGEYKLSGLPLTKRFSGRVVIPKFLRRLYLLVFNDCGSLRTDYCVEAIFFIRQITYGAKKATISCSFDKVEKEVLDFVEVDSHLPEPEGFWSSDEVFTKGAGEVIFHGFEKSPIYAPRVDALDPGNRRRMSACLGALDKVSSVLATTLGPYDPSDWRHKHGPGAVSETTGPSNKYYWKGWSDALELEYPIADCGFHSHASWADRCHSDEGFSSQEPYSRMVAVPKSFSKPRLIAAEPSQNQWCQQNLLHYFSERCANTWIGKFVRFDDQTLNQRLCKVGSSTGALATIDLSSASDRVSCHFVGQLFRKNPKVLRSLRASRTRLVKQRLTPKAPELLTLKKFSTMGNACTFPVESFGFLSVAIACVLTMRNRPVTVREIEKLEEEVAVFGDDIVIPVDCRELFVETLEVLHFKVNERKSFWTGKFRESCGVDSYDGVDVTPVYWKTFFNGRPESLASVVGTVNNLYNRYLMNASLRLASTLPEARLAKVVTGSGVFGLESRSGVDNSHLPRRWNQHLHRFEVRALGTISQQHRTATNDETAILQYFTEAPSPTTKWVHGVLQRPQLKTRLRWVSADSLVSQTS